MKVVVPLNSPTFRSLMEIYYRSWWIQAEASDEKSCATMSHKEWNNKFFKVNSMTAVKSEFFSIAGGKSFLIVLG